MSNKRKSETMLYNSANKMKHDDDKSLLEDFNPQRIPLLSGNIASNLFITQPPNQSIAYNPMIFAQNSRYHHQGSHQQAVNSGGHGRTLNDFLLQFISLCAQFGFQCPIDIASATINFLMHSLQQQMKNGMSQSSMFSIHDSSGMQHSEPNSHGEGCVLMVSNLNDEKITPDALFTLFGVYGDVNRVKIMFNKKDTALIQFATSDQAHLAMKYLCGEELFGKPMFIQLSKSGLVQLPKAGTVGDLTKDYTGSKLHRFRKPHSKNYHNIFSPNNVLHLSNIPEIIDEETIRQYFQQYNFRVLKIRFMQKEKKMALVELEDTDTAMQALIKLHNSQISENSHLRISFSKSGI